MDIEDLIIAATAALATAAIAVGAALIYLPAGLIAAGALALVEVGVYLRGSTPRAAGGDG